MRRKWMFSQVLCLDCQKSRLLRWKRSEGLSCDITYGSAHFFCALIRRSQQLKRFHSCLLTIPLHSWLMTHICHPAEKVIRIVPLWVGRKAGFCYHIPSSKIKLINAISLIMLLTLSHRTFFHSTWNWTQDLHIELHFIPRQASSCLSLPA